jgi:hypothetical protein
MKEGGRYCEPGMGLQLKDRPEKDKNNCKVGLLADLSCTRLDWDN